MDKIDMQKYKNIINKKQGGKKEEGCSVRKYFRSLMLRVIIVVFIFLSLAIICKSSDNLRDNIYNFIYKEDVSFTKIKNLYNKYLGGVLPLKKNINTEKVFNEKLNYMDSSIYYDGVKLSVEDNYLVPALKEGMIVFVGEKENYGNTIIVEDLDGIYIWYGNISNTSLKLYDYIDEGALIGEVNKELYMVFSKEDNYLNYEEYIN